MANKMIIWKEIKVQFNEQNVIVGARTFNFQNDNCFDSELGFFGEEYGIWILYLLERLYSLQPTSMRMDIESENFFFVEVENSTHFRLKKKNNRKR